MVVTEMEREHLEATGDQSRPRTNAHGILIVDDMALNLALLETELEPCGYAIWLADSGNDAIEIYRLYHEQISVVLLAVELPGLDGPHTLAAMRWLNPDIVACFMGGGSRYSFDDLLDRGAVCVFGRPFRATDVSRFLQKLLQPVELDGFICDWSTDKEGWTGSSHLPAGASEFAAVDAPSRCLFRARRHVGQPHTED